jgi:ribosomal protein L4
MYRAGMASILSQLAREGRLAVVDSIKVEAPKTKLLAAKFKAMNLQSVLVIADQVDDNLYPGFAKPAQRAGHRAASCRPAVVGALTRKCW